jgi:coenzyme PQQ synthesis protein D (PqqD)
MSTRHTIHTEALTWREINGEVVILDLEASKYLSLNGTGALLWSALAEGADDAQLIELLTERYGIDEATATRDVDAFLDRCATLGLVQ